MNFKNKNVNSVILDYLNCKDLSKVQQVNKSLNFSTRKFNHKWKEECEEFFLHLNEIMPLNTEDNPYLLTLRKKICKNSCFDYKKIYEKGINILKDWQEEGTVLKKDLDLAKYGSNNSLSMGGFNCLGLSKIRKLTEEVMEEKQGLLEDLLTVRKEIYHSFKYFVGLPSLRQPIPILETENNSALQIYMLDYLYKFQTTKNTKGNCSSLNNFFHEDRNELVKQILNDNTLLLAFYELFSLKYYDSNYSIDQIKKINGNILLRFMRLLTNTSRYMCLIHSSSLKDCLQYYEKHYNEQEDENIQEDYEELNNDSKGFNKNIFSNLFTDKEKEEDMPQMNKGFSQFCNYKKRLSITDKMTEFFDQEELKHKEIGYYLILNGYNKAYKAFISSVNNIDDFFNSFNSNLDIIEKEISIALNKKPKRVKFSTYRLFMHNWFNLVLKDLVNYFPEDASLKIIENDIKDTVIIDFKEFNTGSPHNFEDDEEKMILEEKLIDNLNIDFELKNKRKSILLLKPVSSASISFVNTENLDSNRETQNIHEINNDNYHIPKQTFINYSYFNSNNKDCSDSPLKEAKELINSNNKKLYGSLSNFKKEETKKFSFFYKAFNYLAKRVLVKSLEKYIEKNGHSSDYSSKNTLNYQALYMFLNQHNLATNKNIDFKQQDKLNQFFINKLGVEFYDEFSLLIDIINTFLDVSCTEVNVFRLNLSTFKGKLYSLIEEVIVKIYEDVFKSIFKSDLTHYKSFVQDDDLFKSLPSCTRKKLEDDCVNYYLYLKKIKVDKCFNEIVSQEKCLKSFIEKKKNDNSAKVFLSKIMSTRSTKLSSVLKAFYDYIEHLINNKLEDKSSQKKYYSLSINQYQTSTNRDPKETCSNYSLFNSNNIYSNYNSNKQDSSSLYNSNSSLKEKGLIVSNNQLVSQPIINSSLIVKSTDISKNDYENFAYYVLAEFLYDCKEQYNLVSSQCKILDTLDAFLDYDHDSFKTTNENVQRELKKRNILALIQSMSNEELEYIEDFSVDLSIRDDIISKLRNKC